MSDSGPTGSPTNGPETHGFPLALTNFVGRAEEISRLTRLVIDHRLVTVTGPGGVGKTRLATEVARRLPEQLAEHVWLVDLAATSDPRRVASAVAAALGIQQRADRSTAQAVGAVVARDRALLLLDNCEHVVDAVAEFCHNLLSGRDDPRILTTSREPLGVPGEARLRLRPLPVGTVGKSHMPDASEAAGVRLFVDRVRLVDPTFDSVGVEAALVRRIVQRLDGLPLAIELAAARCESLGIVQLLDRLDEPLAVLTDVGRTGPQRQRSLRDTVDWSYRLLSQQERQVFRRIAIFSASFTLAAAKAVAGDGTEPTLLRLVELSLLAPPSRAVDGSVRYSMLQGLRAFGDEKLSHAGERINVATAMCAYYTTTAPAAALGIRTPGAEGAAAAWFDAEDALLHQALALAEEYDNDGALRLATAMAGWWQLRGRALTGYELLRRALDAHQERDAEWFAGQTWLGRLAQSTARWRAALEHFSAVCEGLESDAGSSAFVEGLAGRSGTLRNLSRLSDATETAHRALEIARQLDYAEGEALALTQLSLAAGYAGDEATAKHYAGRAAEIDGSRLPDRLARRVALVVTLAEIDSGDLEAARGACADGLESARAAGDVPGQADFCSCAARIALRTGDIEQAAAHIRESLPLTGLSADLLRIVGCLDDCAQLCAATGRWTEALTLWAAHATQTAVWGLPELARDALQRRISTRDAGPTPGHGADAAGGTSRRGNDPGNRYGVRRTGGRRANPRGRPIAGVAHSEGARGDRLGRSRSHRCGDRGRTVHQYPDGPVTSGPDP